MSEEASCHGCVVGIAGPSGSGKTTLARRLAGRFSGECLVISQDRYYRDLSDLPVERREWVNFDHPDALDWQAFAGDLKALKAGREAMAPVYDFRSHTRASLGETIRPRPLLIVEGILILHVPLIRGQVDYGIYLDVASDIRFIRRLKRDIGERGRMVESVIRQYISTVRPMYERYVRPSARFADLVLDTGGETDIEPIVSRVRGMLDK